jgi:hypothetical protein
MYIFEINLFLCFYHRDDKFSCTEHVPERRKKIESMIEFGEKM